MVLALKLGRPTILLAAEAQAIAFFRTIAVPDTLQEAATPEAAIDMIERSLGVPRWPRTGPDVG